MQPYETHTPILTHLLENLPLTKVLELGIGLHSTPFFHKWKPRLDIISVENNEFWIKKMEHTKFPVVLSNILEFIRGSDDEYDLALVDCTTSERADCVRELMGRVRVIVAHDTEPQSEWDYHYSEIELPEGFVRLDITSDIPWTSVYTNDSQVIASVQQFLDNE